MDYDNVIADETYFGKVTHYTSGRGGNSIQYVVLHHNGGFNTLDNIVQTFNSRGVSAHYQVDQSGQVGQYVYDADTAYHAGNWAANQRSIGIEHANNSVDPYTISDATLDGGAHLVAALCIKYGLGRPEYGSNVYPHKHFSSTDCPGSLGEDGSQRDAYMAQAQAYYDSMTNGTAAPDAPSGTDNGSSSDTESDGGGSLALDGDFGYYTILALQEFLRSVGTYGDGLALDGEAGYYTYLALQEYLRQTGDYGDGLALDGVNGGWTAQALQEFLRREGYYGSGLTIDQNWGYYTTLALQEFLRAKGFYN